MADDYRFGGDEESLEALWGRDLDNAALDAAEQEEEARATGGRVILPEGDYTTIPELNVKRFISDYGDSRRIISYFGSVVGLNGNSRSSGKLRFKLSPDEAMNQAQTQKSLDYRLYVQARRVYKDQYGASPTLTELEAFVRDHPLKLRVIKGTKDNLVVAITAIASTDDDEIPF